MSFENITKPNFFILGGPKCGTTALSEYLREHPDIFFSKDKEPYFFNDDFVGKEKLVGVTAFRDEKEYLEKEFNGFADYKVVGEGTPMYLFSRTAVPNILKFNPEAKFIVMVRNPVEMAHSLHAQILMGLTEDVADFETAWRLQEDRLNGRNLPNYCKVPQILQYGEICKLGEQLERLYDNVPKERVLVILYDDFCSDTRREYIKVLEFLGVDYGGRKNFEFINVSKKVSNPAVHKLVVLVTRMKKKLGIDRSLGLAKRLFRFYGREEKRVPLSEDFKNELRKYFMEDVALLSLLIGRDLSSWTHIK